MLLILLLLYFSYLLIEQLQNRMNLWNLKYSKERLAILDRTQAQKKHLVSLINTKNVVDSKSRYISRSIQKPWRQKFKSTGNRSVQDNPITKPNNKIILSKIGNTSKLTNDQNLKLSQCKFLDLSQNILQNHSAIFKITSNMKQKRIDAQNSKIFNRLVSTSPVLKRSVWQKNNIQHNKIKSCMAKTRYKSPDYSIAANSLLDPQCKTKFQLKFLRPDVSKFSSIKINSLNRQSIVKYYKIRG